MQLLKLQIRKQKIQKKNRLKKTIIKINKIIVWKFHIEIISEILKKQKEYL